MEHLYVILLACLYRLSGAAHLDKRQSHRLSAWSTSTPAPIEFPASQDFDGPDGPWSSFALQVGTPPQTVKVLISTASDQTWVVLPQGCMSKDPSNCETSRGGVFSPDQSDTWLQNDISPNGTFSTGLESNLGYFSNVKYGFDTVTLGWRGSGGPSLQNQVVAGIATKDFYLGLFGINPRPSNFTNFDITFPSFISGLKNNFLISSVSYAYTSGNQYRLNKVFGSLTLGGYDSSRFISNEVKFSFDQVDERDLTVAINSITMTAGGTTSSLMSKAIRAFVDSTIPYLYLPLPVCEQFETAFGLTFNTTVQAYLVNDTLHQKLLDQDASVTFTLANSINTTQIVDITLPYAAFDLLADYPLMPIPSRYFPLMRATNDSQYTLGRTFLQEAYLVADYERLSFTISQCDWSSASQQPKIVPIKPYSSTVPQTSHHIPTSSIVGAAVGAFVALSLALALLYWLYPRIKTRFGGVQNDLNKVELDTLPRVTKLEIGSDPLKPELDSTARNGPELDGDKTARVEMQDQHDWVPELQADGHSTSHNPLKPELDSKARDRSELNGDETLKRATQDQHNWDPESKGENGHSTTYEMDADQDWVAELPAMSKARMSSSLKEKHVKADFDEINTRRG